jgi:hypothetical protein
VFSLSQLAVQVFTRRQRRRRRRRPGARRAHPRRWRPCCWTRQAAGAKRALLVGTLGEEEAVELEAQPAWAAPLAAAFAPFLQHRRPAVQKRAAAQHTAAEAAAAEEASTAAERRARQLPARRNSLERQASETAERELAACSDEGPAIAAEKLAARFRAAVQVLVSPPSGAPFALVLAPGDALRRVQLAVRDRLAIPPRLQHVTRAGRPLRAGDALADGDTLRLSLRLAGGSGVAAAAEGRGGGAAGGRVPSSRRPPARVWLRHAAAHQPGLADARSEAAAKAALAAGVAEMGGAVSELGPAWGDEAQPLAAWRGAKGGTISAEWGASDFGKGVWGVDEAGLPTRLFLYGLGLRGPLSAQVCRLMSLTHLCLRGNQLEALPDAIGRLTPDGPHLSNQLTALPDAITRRGLTWLGGQQPDSQPPARRSSTAV